MLFLKENDAIVNFRHSKLVLDEHTIDFMFDSEEIFQENTYSWITEKARLNITRNKNNVAENLKDFISLYKKIIHK